MIPRQREQHSPSKHHYQRRWFPTETVAFWEEQERELGQGALYRFALQWLESLKLWASMHLQPCKTLAEVEAMRVSGVTLQQFLEHKHALDLLSGCLNGEDHKNPSALPPSDRLFYHYIVEASVRLAVYKERAARRSVMLLQAASLQTGSEDVWALPEKLLYDAMQIAPVGAWLAIEEEK